MHRRQERVGIDGCRGGWAYFHQNRRGNIDGGVASSFADIAHKLDKGARVYVDMPIGLIDHGSAQRLCDREARSLLQGKKAASIFAAPCRPVLAARDYEQAKEISLQAIGKKLSLQSYALVPKIKEIDDFLAQNPHQLEIREVHPEVCFWALNKHQAVIENKKSKAGLELRLQLLESVLPQARNLFSQQLQLHKRKTVLADDLVDALVVLTVAMSQRQYLRTVPAQPPKDARGLAMEIVYAEPPKGAS